MKIGGLILLNAVAIFQNVQDLLADGKTPYERRFGEPLKGPTIPSGAMVECHPVFFTRDQSRVHQFGEKVLPGIFRGYGLIAGDDFGKETFWSQTLRNWRTWTRQKSMLGGSVQKKC